MKKFIVLLLTLFTTQTAFAGNFIDVVGHLYEDGIDILSTRGIVNGYEDRTFRPDKIINRAELLKILMEGELILSDQPSITLDSFGNNNCFNDVAADQWFTKYICAAKDRGIVVGYEDGNFRPAQEVNFVEAIKMALETTYVPYLVTDNPWYRGPVEAAGFGNYIPFTINSFDKKLTRAEMADMITRIITKRQSTQNEYLGERQYIIATYESIAASQDLSNSQVFPLPPEPEPIETSNLAQYVDYSAAAVAGLADDQLGLLNFHASWCVTCMLLDSELRDPQKLAQLPNNLIIFKIEYDDNPDLRRDYSVVIQHTLVQIDKNGNEITKWIGGGVETILVELQT